MSDNGKEAEEKMAKAIFMCADCWLKVFDFLTPSQLGLGIALISHRFDFYVDEHFKTRKWAFESILIRRKNGKNGTKEMEIANSEGKPMPIPQIQMPRKVTGFKCIVIFFIDQNAIAFLGRFRQLFTSFPINLYIYTASHRISEFILRNIWPMIAKNIHGIYLPDGFFHRLSKFVPSILNDCPSLRFVSSHFDKFFIEFPCDVSAAASDGQAIAKWLFTPLQNNMPKVIQFYFMNDRNLASKIEAFKTFKTVFSLASSPVNFIVTIRFLPPSLADSVVPFDLINELTRELLALKRINNSDRFLLIRCPIARDESKWTKWEKEAIGWQIYNQWNKINIQIDENKIGDGLLDATPGPSDQE